MATHSKTLYVQQYCRDAFSDVRSPSFVAVNDFLAFLTLLSIASIVLETVPALEPYYGIFLTIEYITVFFFTLEYLGRIIAADKPVKYMTSFFGVIDLISIVPTFLGLANLTFLKSVRILRIMRFLRMLRLAKIARLSKVHADVEEHGHDALFHLTLQIYIAAFFGAVIFGGALMWFAEGSREVFASIPLAMIWSAKVLLGGVMQAVPETIGGELIAIFLRFVGLLLFGLLIGIVGGSVKKLLFGTAELARVRKQKKRTKHTARKKLRHDRD